MNIEGLIGDLALILVLGAISTIIFRKLKQPIVLGYIVAGFLVGPHFTYFPTIHNEDNIEFWAQIGIIVLLFSLGLEFSFKKLMNVGGSAIVTALIIVSGMMGLGVVVGHALDFSNTLLRDCMIPRNEIVAIDIDSTSRERLSRMFTETGLSKILVYREDIDNILGYIHVCELFKKDSDWTKNIKPVMFAPETMLAKQLMQNMLSAKKSVTIVVDEFGGTAGMLTLEDLVEEIFGEIEDEHDRKRKKLVSRRVSDNVYELSGRLEIEAINEAYNLDIPEKDDYQTLAGYLLFNLEELPDEGETLRIDRFVFTVLKKTAAKIELVRLEVMPEGSVAEQD